MSHTTTTYSQKTTASITLRRINTCHLPVFLLLPFVILIVRDRNEALLHFASQPSSIQVRPLSTREDAHTGDGEHAKLIHSQQLFAVNQLYLAEQQAIETLE